MSALSLTLKGRKAAEALMVDTCRVERVTGRTTDPDTGEVVTTVEVVYDGPGKLQTQNPYPSEPNAGERVWTLAQTEVHLPMDTSGDVGTDDVVTVSSALDTASVGRTFRVRSAIRKTFQTANRLLVEEVTN